MSRRFRRGLVVGKFSPLHRGHEMVIRRAIEECEETIVISYSKPELPGCDAARRDNWFASIFSEVRHLAVSDERLRTWPGSRAESIEVPDNDAPATVHRRFCGYLCRHILGISVDAVFTSEDYGDGFATELTRYFRENDPSALSVEHVLVDRERRMVPISGTTLRRDIHASREWLSPSVYASFVEKVCVLGGESSGKSTLAEALATHFATRHVAEYGRELWEARKGRLEFDDMLHIAEVQVQREGKLAGLANRYLFCDTSPLTTLFYSQHTHGKAERSLEQMAERPYDHTILCAPDFAFVQDGTRQLEEFRMLQHEWYTAELSRRGIPHLLVTGSLEDRVMQVDAALRSGSER